MTSFLQKPFSFPRIKEVYRDIFGLPASPSFPFSIAPDRVYILPSRLGYMFGAVLLVMLTGSLNYNNNMGFMFTFLLGGMTIVSLIHTRNNISKLTVISIKFAPPFAGETLKTTISVKSDHESRPGLSFNFKGEQEHTKDIEAGLTTNVDVYIKTSRRGGYKFPLLIISTTYPFGLFRAWSRINMEREYTVYPKAIRGARLSRGLARTMENEGDTETEGIDDFKEIRSYRPGDRLTRLHWKSLSRGHGLMTKEFTGQAGSSITINWDTLPESDRETKISMLCGLVLTAHDMGLSYGLVIPGLKIEPENAAAVNHKTNCLKALALMS